MTLKVEIQALITQFLALIGLIMTLWVERNHINYTISSSHNINYDIVRERELHYVNNLWPTKHQL
jgi:hypothetical protein